MQQQIAKDVAAGVAGFIGVQESSHQFTTLRTPSYYVSPPHIALRHSASHSRCSMYLQSSNPARGQLPLTGASLASSLTVVSTLMSGQISKELLLSSKEWDFLLNGSLNSCAWWIPIFQTFGINTIITERREYIHLNQAIPPFSSLTLD